MKNKKTRIPIIILAAFKFLQLGIYFFSPLKMQVMPASLRGSPLDLDQIDLPQIGFSFLTNTVWIKEIAGNQPVLMQSNYDKSASRSRNCTVRAKTSSAFGDCMSY